MCMENKQWFSGKMNQTKKKKKKTNGPPFRLFAKTLIGEVRMA